MPALYEGPVQTLIDELGRLPGVGTKSAQRIAFHLLRLPQSESARLARAITEMKARITFCERCFNLAEGPRCGLCNDARRDDSVICVVEDPRDVVAIERTSEFHGRYHVLHGAINHTAGIGAEQLKLRELVQRLTTETVTELIIATNPNLEGEVTAMYITRLLGGSGLRITRLASGLPVGTDLEFADELTLGRALEGRREMTN